MEQNEQLVNQARDNFLCGQRKPEANNMKINNNKMFLAI